MSDKLTKFDKATVRQLHETMREIAKNFEEIGAKLAKSRGVYTAETFKLTLEFQIDAPETGQKLFERECGAVGLKPTDFGREVTWNGDKFKVTGVAPRSRKYPVLVKRASDGKGFKLPARACWTPRVPREA
jgi:hypothetical protein